MYTKQQLKDFAKKQKLVPVDNLKDEFIKSFGETKWNEEEMLSKIIPFGDKVASHLGLDSVPILFEDLGEEDSRIYFKEQYIAISKRYSKDYEECIKCIAHEYRHLFQFYLVTLFKDDKTVIGDLARLYKEDFDNQIGIDNYQKYMMQVIEVDAYAFTKVYLKKYYSLDIKISNENYSKIVDEFIKSYY